VKSETRRLEKKYRKNKTAETLKIWRTQFDFQRRYFQQVRRIYWSNTIQGCTDPKSLWRKLNCLLHPLAASVPPQTPNAFATFFKDKTEVIRASTAAARDPDIQRRAVASFDSFGQFSTEDIADAIRKAPNKQCAIDPVPAWIIKQSSDILVPILLAMVNKSFETGVFPENLKHAIVRPILKKPSLDPFELKSYRPISNLSFTSKLIERLAVNRFNQHISTNQLLPDCQSAYRRHHSTETAVAIVINNIARTVDSGKVCALALLDLSAAFDMVDHCILSKVLERHFAVEGVALAWFQSYFSR